MYEGNVTDTRCALNTPARGLGTQRWSSNRIMRDWARYREILHHQHLGSSRCFGANCRSRRVRTVQVSVICNIKIRRKLARRNADDGARLGTMKKILAKFPLQVLDQQRCRIYEYTGEELASAQYLDIAAQLCYCTAGY